MMSSAHTNIFYFVSPMPRPALFLATRVAGCDEITALLSNCHLNRKFAYRNDRNDASEACTKSASHRGAVLDVPREIWRHADYWYGNLCFFLSQIDFPCKQSSVLSSNSREALPLRIPTAQLRFVRDSRDDVRVNAFTSVADNLRGSLLSEIARVFPTTSIPQVR